MTIITINYPSLDRYGDGRDCKSRALRGQLSSILRWGIPIGITDKTRKRKGESV